MFLFDFVLYEYFHFFHHFDLFTSLFFLLFFYVCFTGEGAGIINITAGYGGIILSEIYGIVDAIYYDPCTNNTTSRYIVNTTDGNSLSFVNNSMRLTIGSNNKYVNLDTNSAYATLSDYAGKTIRFTADIKPSNRCRLICYQQVSGSWSEVHTDYTTTEGTLTLDIEIAENASRVQFRVDCSNGNSGDTVDINNWTLHTF